MINFAIGADPEIFVGDSSGNPKSIIGKIGGSKWSPRPLPIGDGFCVQEDNVALEFNIPASRSKAEFVSNICLATGFLEKEVIDRYNLKFLHTSAISFPQEEMYDPAAFEFGCDPDYNAWTKAENPRPSATDPLLRSCGGHVHIGCKNLDVIQIVKGCDLFLGVPSVLMDKDGGARRVLYGKRGAFRKKPYGVEYRTLSNFWVFNPDTISWVYDGVSRVLDAVSNKFEFDAEQEAIQEAIDNNNSEVALQLVNKYNITMV